MTIEEELKTAYANLKQHQIRTLYYVGLVEQWKKRAIEAERILREKQRKN